MQKNNLLAVSHQKVVNSYPEEAGHCVHVVECRQAFAKTIDAKDKYTKGHSVRVARYSRELVKRMGGTIREQDEIYQIALLHDMGKIRIPDNIINKPGRLTDEEFSMIKLHCVNGYHILKNINAFPELAVGAKYHHERYDGTGYPSGLKGENIPRCARIIAVADSMT